MDSKKQKPSKETLEKKQDENTYGSSIRSVAEVEVIKDIAAIGFVGGVRPPKDYKFSKTNEPTETS